MCDNSDDIVVFALRNFSTVVVALSTKTVSVSTSKFSFASKAIVLRH
jgi:hypothetical protein